MSTPPSSIEEVAKRVKDARAVRWVPQEHPDGCGVAALAMAAGQEYDEVAAAFSTFPEQEVTDHGIGVYMERRGWFRRAIWRAEDCGGVWPPAPFADVHIAIVHNPNSGHFVVMDHEGRVYDPLSPEPRRLTDWEVVNGVYGFTHAAPQLAQWVEKALPEMQRLREHIEWLRGLMWDVLEAHGHERGELPRINKEEALYPLVLGILLSSEPLSDADVAWAQRVAAETGHLLDTPSSLAAEGTPE